MGLRRSLWVLFFGIPHGALGVLGARLMPRLVGPLYPMLADELRLQPEDDLLDVGCGLGRLLVEQAADVRFVAGIDRSEIQVRLARGRLADRIATGTAEIVLGDAMSLPWEDARFSAVSSLNCLKFVPDADRALREMHRVLRPDGRLAITIDHQEDRWGRSGEIDAMGQWQWSVEDARRMVEAAGFRDVTVTDLPTRLGIQVIRATKRETWLQVSMPNAVTTVAEAPVLVGAAR
jgi:SAM-dependent methyltransferase